MERPHSTWHGGDISVVDHARPSLPSPTLTNPDMVLPTGALYTATTAFPTRRDRPPSPSHLRGWTDGPPAANGAVPPPSAARREKRGLMSRKMMLVRSLTGELATVQGTPPPGDHVALNAFASPADSPAHQDLGGLHPSAAAEEKRLSNGSSFNSSDLAEAQNFLSKYEAKPDDAATDYTSLLDPDEKADRATDNSSSRLSNELEERRKEQEQEEHTSAILSQRAELILANAKKRLNLMEGNLRGARDLVAPLTAANLKRATSMTSFSTARPNEPGQFGSFGPLSDLQIPSAVSAPRFRLLHSQASSPTMGRDYRLAQPLAGADSFQPLHNRGWSDNLLPERPSVPVNNNIKSTGSTKPGRFPVKINRVDRTIDAVNQTLRGSRSQDALSRLFGHQQLPLQEHTWEKSPDFNLDPLPEDERSYPGHRTYKEWTSNQARFQSIFRSASATDYYPPPSSSRSQSPHMLRPACTTEDLRMQMSNLKGKISTLRERAMEDSLRRTSMQNLRTPSPLNNATHSAPEMYYIEPSSQAASPSELDNVDTWNAHGVPTAAQRKPQHDQQEQPAVFEDMAFLAYTQEQDIIRDRELASAQSSSRPQTANYDPVPPNLGLDARPQVNTAASQLPSFVVPRVTPELAQETNGEDYGIDDEDEIDEVDEYVDEVDGNIDETDEGVDESDEFDKEDNELVNRDVQGTDSTLIYELQGVSADPRGDQSVVVAHEDREDAFDYRRYFLQASMAHYNIAYSESEMSAPDSESEASTETARGPTRDDQDDSPVEIDDIFLRSPQTPERLRQVEMNIHRRSFSSESTSTVGSFATAAEGRESPSPLGELVEQEDWPIPPAHRLASSTVKTSGGASTRSDGDSDRADSGVGLPRRSIESQRNRPDGNRPHTAVRLISPPMSPSTMLLHDPTTLAVNALLDPRLPQLGLKDKSMLFGIIEELRKLTHQLQQREDASYENRVLRKRLDEVKNVLRGFG